MTIVFFGNTKYSLLGAKIIHKALGLSRIVTNNPRPDRKGVLIPSPLQTFAIDQDLPFTTTDRLNDEIIAKIAALKPDFLVVEDYGLILPKSLLELPKYTCLNIHHSLLPKYRGSSPAPTALLNGDPITGVTIIKMSDRVDAGDILAQKEYAVKTDDTTDSLLTTLNTLGAELLVQVIEQFESIKPQPQDESLATFTKMIKKVDGYIDSHNQPSPEKIDCMIRAYYPWPTVWTKLEINGKEKIVKLLPGKKLQVEGKNPMSMKDFLNGYPDLKPIIEKLFG